MGGFGAASYGTAYPGKLAGYVLSSAWTRDHKGLAKADEALSDSTYVPNELGDGVCSDPAVGEAYLADPLVAKEFSVALLRAVHEGHDWLRATRPRSPIRSSCCTAATTAWCLRRTASTSSRKSHPPTSRCASMRASITRSSRVQARPGDPRRHRMAGRRAGALAHQRPRTACDDERGLDPRPLLLAHVPACAQPCAWNLRVDTVCGPLRAEPPKPPARPDSRQASPSLPQVRASHVSLSFRTREIP